MTIKSMTLAATTLVLSTSVNAAIITHGALTTNDDGSTNIITDSLNNYEWLRFDVLAPLTYAETLAVLGTQDGGGWSIAGINEAMLFLDAYSAPSSQACSPAGSTTICITNSNYSDGDFGPNFDTDSDYVWYYGDTTDVNYLQLSANDGVVYDYSYGTYAQSDDYSASGEKADISWLVYRSSVSPVPIPAAVWLFGSGLLGLVGVARRKTA